MVIFLDAIISTGWQHNSFMKTVNIPDFLTTLSFLKYSKFNPNTKFILHEYLVLFIPQLNLFVLGYFRSSVKSVHFSDTIISL